MSDVPFVSGRFEMRRHLGAGGMGRVFEAFDRKLQTKVALKTVLQGDTRSLPFLKNEFRTLADVRHPNLPQLLELVEESGQFFVVMELIDGQALGDYLGLQNPPENDMTTGTMKVRRPSEPNASEDPPELFHAAKFERRHFQNVMLQLAAGLHALHQHGKVHGDVKPSNVLVTADGRTVLVDFGLARDERSFLSVRSLGWGTRAFMAPEQAAQQEITAAADWYSFGVILYLALTGELPFTGPELGRDQLRGTIPERAVPTAMSELFQLARALLVSDPTGRPRGERVLEHLGGGAGGVRASVGSPFVGRKSELLTLADALRSSRHERSSVLVVGASGLGKSRLVREFVAQAEGETPELVAFAGRCYEREVVPYKALDAVVDRLSEWLAQLDPTELAAYLPRDAAILVRAFPVLGSALSQAASADLGHANPEEEVSPADWQEQRARAFASLGELFRRVAERRPVVLFIDDLQWADADSFLLLTDLLESQNAPRVCFVGTVRADAEALPALVLLADSWRKHSRLALGPLATNDSEELVRTVLGDVSSVALVRSVAAEAKGHPLFLQALSVHVRYSGVFEPGALRLEDALLAEVGALDRSSRHLLELVAVSGAPLSTRALRKASGLAELGFEATSAELRARRLVRGLSSDASEQLETYHDRVRETVLGGLDAERRRGLHSELAGALEGLGPNAQESFALIGHLEGAGMHDAAAQRARIAAKAAEDALAFDQAAELYRTALTLGEPALDQKIAVLRSLVAVLAAAGRAFEAAAASLELSNLVPSGERLLARRTAADHLLRSGYLEEGLAILSELLREVGAKLGSQRRSLALTLLRRFRLQVRGLDWNPDAAASVAETELQRSDLYHAIGVSLALIDPARGAAFEIRALELALETGDASRLGPILIMEAGYEASVGASGLERARSLVSEAKSIATARGDVYALTAVPMMEGFMSFHAGEFRRAAATLLAVERQFQALKGRYFEQAFCHCFALVSLRNAGEWGQIDRGYESWVRLAERRSDRFTEAALRFNLNGVWLVRNEPERAWHELAQVRWIPPAGGYHVQHWYAAQARAEIHLYRGTTEEGLQTFRSEMDDLRRSFILRMRLHRSHATWLLGRLILAEMARAGAAPRRVQEVKRLALQLKREGVGFADVWGALLMAGAWAAGGERGRVRMELRSAVEAARRAGLVHLEHTAEYFASEYEDTLGAPARRAKALSWAGEQKIRNPARLFGSWGAGLGSETIHVSYETDPV